MSCRVIFKTKCFNVRLIYFKNLFFDMWMLSGGYKKYFFQTKKTNDYTGFYILRL